jgi:hypothetical protein
MSTGKFIAWAAAIAGVLAVGIWWLVPDDRPWGWAGMGVNFLLTSVAYAIVAKGLEKRPMQFTGYVMGGMMVKMMVGIAVILAVGLRFKEHLLTYALTFVITYFAFTGFEVYGLIRKLRRISKTG